MVGACCILHNICVSEGDILEEEEEEDDVVHGNTECVDRDLSGNGVRGRLSAQLSAPKELADCLREHDYI